MKGVVLLKKIRQKMKHLKSFNQLMIILGTYKSFRTARAAKREIVPLLALLALFKMINLYRLQVAEKR